MKLSNRLVIGAVDLNDLPVSVRRIWDEHQAVPATGPAGPNGSLTYTDDQLRTAQDLLDQIDAEYERECAKGAGAWSAEADPDHAAFL